MKLGQAIDALMLIDKTDSYCDLDVYVANVSNECREVTMQGVATVKNMNLLSGLPGQVQLKAGMMYHTSQIGEVNLRVVLTGGGE